MMDTESSSEDQTSTECSTDSSDDDEKLETAQIYGTRLQLPQGLCERKDVFDEFFSPATWNSFSEMHKQHLKSFLPTFSENDEHEKNVTLAKLFDGEVFRFNSPLQQFHEQLRAGHYRPDIARMRLLIKKAERKEAKFRHKLFREKLQTEIVESRNKLLNLARNLPPGGEPRMDRQNSVQQLYINPISFRTKRRYFQELTAIREKVEETGYSSDENYPEGPPTPVSRKQKRHLNTLKNSALISERVISSVTVKTNCFDLERHVTPNYNPFFITEDAYRNFLVVHKRRKLETPSEPEFNTSGITVTDIIGRTDLSSFKKLSSATSVNSIKSETKPVKKKIKKECPPSVYSPELVTKTNPFFGHSSNSELDSDSDSFFDLSSRSKKSRKIKKEIKKEIKVEPLEVFSSDTHLEIKTEDIKPLNSQYGKVAPATLSDLDGIDMMNLPIDLDDSNIDILEFNNKPELMQETHSNFLSLVRDIICSTNEHRMTMKILEDRLKSWQENPISPLNDWYSLTDNWVALLPLAINFLSGNCSEQPDDFVPYIEYKTGLDMYQWIGAGRDSDSLLAPLCLFWLDHRGQMKPTLPIKEKEEEVEVSDRSQTPPPPRCPTTWSIRKANYEEVKSFQEQERQRYNNPHKAFTYRCNGYESVVGPVKGIYNNQNLGTAKARGHSILTDDRPNFVTILTLVRDATARLPNGEGTRADICELLKSSQYLSINVPDNILQSVVSGALDRMHTQFDPCVKYEPKRKVWIYLHRNRSEEDFERIHQQYQGMKNLKKPKNKLIKPKRTDKSKTKLNAKADKIEKPEQSDLQSPETSKPKPAPEQPSTTSTWQQKVMGHTPARHSPQRKCPTKSIQKPPPLLQEKQPGESLLVSQSNSKPPANKNLVKVITSNQGKSLIIPTANTQLLKQIEQKLTPNKQQQMFQTIAQQKQLLLQKQNEQKVEKISKPPVSFQQQILPQSIKNVTLLRNTSSAISSQTSSVPVSAVAQPEAVKEAAVTFTTAPQQPIVQEQVIQSGVQNKITQPKLTPAQQQQILQTLKQKVLPLQQTVVTSQYRTVPKQKAGPSQMQKQVQPTASILGQNKVTVTDNIQTKTVITSAQTPLVAKVLTNAAGQVISVESLLAHQKQHGTLPQGTTLRLSGTKAGQPNVIQIAASSSQNPATQFTLATQNISSVSSHPKLVISTPTTTSVTSTLAVSKPAPKPATKTQTATKFVPKIAQQLIGAKFVQSSTGQKLVQPKVIVGQQNQVKIPISSKNVAISKSVGITVAANPNTIRMVSSANLNLAQISGKPVLITSKANAFQNIQGQNIIIQTQANTSQGLVISNPDKTINSSISQQNSVSLSQQNAQMILSPPLKVQQAPQMMLSNAIKQQTVGLASANQSTTGQIMLGGQAVRLQTSGATNTHRVVLASQNQGQIITQQILLPVGFQGTPLNIKALQGLKVVPIAQTQQSRGVQGRQVFARVMNPANVVRVQSTEATDLGSSSKSAAD